MGKPLAAVALGNPYETMRALQELEKDIRSIQRIWARVIKNGEIVANHENLRNIGSLSHAQLDAHVADSTIHFTAASITIPVVQATAPATDGTDGRLWINNNANPHIAYVLLNNASGTGQWVQFSKGLP